MLLEENFIKIQEEKGQIPSPLQTLSEGSKPPHPQDAPPSPHPPSLHAHPELLLDFASWYPCKAGIILVWMGNGKSRLDGPSLGFS